MPWFKKPNTFRKVTFFSVQSHSAKKTNKKYSFDEETGFLLHLNLIKNLEHSEKESL